MKINLLNTLDGFKLASDADYEQKRKLKLGKIYQFETKLLRNYEFLQKYHKLITVAFEYQNEKVQEHFHNSIESFRKTVQVAAGHCDTYYSISRKEWVEESKSISFEKMEEEEFQDLYNKVKDVLFLYFLKNISEEEFIKNLINF